MQEENLAPIELSAEEAVNLVEDWFAGLLGLDHVLPDL